MRQRVRWVAALAALALTGLACSSDEPSVTGPSPEAGIAVTLSDFKIKAAETEAPAGPVTLDLTNDGPADHTFALVRTDLADDALPVAGHLVLVSELDVVAQIDRFDYGTERTLALDLEPGSYVMFCMLAGHYESDMHAAFSVT